MERIKVIFLFVFVMGLIMVITGEVNLLTDNNINNLLVLGGIILLGCSLGYLLIASRFLDLTIPVSKYNLRKRENFEKMFKLTDETLKKTPKFTPTDSADPYFFKELERKFTPIDYYLFLTIRSRIPQPDSHKFHHYEEVPIKEFSDMMRIKRYFWIIVISSILLVIIFLSTALWSSNLGDNETIEQFLLINFGLTVFILLLLGGWFYSVVQNYKGVGSVDEEIVEPITTNSALISFSLGLVTTILLYFWGYSEGWITFSLETDYGTIIGLIALAIALWLISHIEGKYFTMWCLHLWHRINNWDFLQGEPLASNDDKSKVVIKRFLSILALGSLLVGAITALADIFKLFFVTSNPIVDQNFIEELLNFLPGPTPIYLLLIGLGPLLSLLVNPLGFVEIWLHQGIYDKINSGWETAETKSNQLFFNDVARFPPIDSQLMINLVRITTLTLILLSLMSIADSIAVILDFPGLVEVVWLGKISSEVVFLSSILFSLFSLKEEKTINVLATYSKKFNRHLFNELMHAEWILSSQLDVPLKFEAMTEWVNSSPRSWGVPYLFQGFLYSRLEAIRELTPDERQQQIDSYKKSLEEGMVLLPGMKEIGKSYLEKISK